MNDARRRFATTITGAAGSSFRGLVSGATSMVAGALTLGGGFAIADTIHKRLAAERSASLLVNQVTTGGVAPKGADVNSILNRASATSIATGMSKEELVGGALALLAKSEGRRLRGGDGEHVVLRKDGEDDRRGHQRHSRSGRNLTEPEP